MKCYRVPVVNKQEIAEGIFAVSFESGELAASARPGQFVNIRVEEGYAPLLRRPFSISHVEGSTLEIIFNVVGAGTRGLAAKQRGAWLDVLGPLGVPYTIDDTYQEALLVAGGLGVAPFPFVTGQIGRGKRIETFLGARTKSQVVDRFLVNVHVATDDGSMGHHGTVVDLLERHLKEHPPVEAKIFACGPTSMLKALTAFALNNDLRCELSLEGDMACGIGICQGCPVERTGGEKKYALVCTEGPAFECREVLLP